MTGVHMTLAGALIAIIIAVSTAATLFWMLHPPASLVQKLAKEAESELVRMVGSILVVFSPDILSGHMLALAAKLARRQKTELLALYIIEVPYTLPPDAEMVEEERVGLDALGAAETIAINNGVDLRTEIVKARVTSQAVLDIAKREKADLIILGSFREGKYTGAPLGRAIETIAAEAKCDVLIGVEGKHGTLLVDETLAIPDQPV
ncbi:MAG TPA: universal stress protein [Verrucomicrobiae bacterium]|jgi:nucleotide-binding universal stress UspA family protein|nr:universal stress protein [Verrucomicrobiae bacterium]